MSILVPILTLGAIFGVFFAFEKLEAWHERRRR